MYRAVSYGWRCSSVLIYCFWCIQKHLSLWNQTVQWFLRTFLAKHPESLLLKPPFLAVEPQNSTRIPFFFQSLPAEFVSWTSQPLRLTPEKTPNELSLMIDMIVGPNKDPQNVKFIYRSLWDWILPFWCYRRTKHHGDPQMPRPVGWGPRKIASDSVQLPKKSGWILCLTMVYGRHNMT